MRRVIGSVGLIAIVLVTMAAAVMPSRAVEQGTITAMAIWAAGQTPAEVVEVCFVVTADAAATEILGRACTSDESYAVSFGPADPPLQTGVTYYVWEDVRADWEILGDNPLTVVIPDTTGAAVVTFENRRAEGAFVEVHQFVCPPGFNGEIDQDYYEACHAEPRVGVGMSATGPDGSFLESRTDEEGIARFDEFTVPGEITIAEMEPSGGFGSYVVVCSRIGDKAEVPTKNRGDGRAAFAFDLAADTIAAGFGVICEWYNIPPAPPVPIASLTIHVSTCPANVAPADRFAGCHENGLIGDELVLQGPVNDEGVTAGHLGAVRWDGLLAGVYTVAEAMPTGDFVDYAVFCSRLDSTEAVNFERRGDGRAAVQVELGVGAQVVCDWYNIAPVATPQLDFRIAAFDCPTDPGSVSLAAGNIPSSCEPATGAAFTVAAEDGTWVASCIADAKGLCIVQLPNEMSVIVTEDIGTVTGGYAPRENPIFTEVRTEFAGALFINLPVAVPAPTVPPAPTPTPVEGRPIHVHAGTCNDLASSPRYPLTDLTTPEATSEGAAEAAVAEVSYTVIDISLDELLATPHSINAHLNDEDMEVYVVCGEIGGPRRTDGAIVIGLREQNDSGLVGIAYLIPDPTDPERTQISVFLAPGLAEADRSEGTPAASPASA